MTGLPALVLALLRRDLALAFRQGGSGWLPLGFFVVVTTLFPLGLGPGMATLSALAPGLVWVSALLAVLISLDRMYQSDYEDGALDLLRLSPLSLTAIVGAKILAHWLTTGLPLIVASPVLAILLNLPAEALGVLVLSLAIGTPVLSLVGSIGAALTVSLRRGGLLIPLLVLPLYVPVLIFGVGAVDATLAEFGAAPHLKLLGAMLLVAAALGPLASAAALKLATE